MAADHPFLAEYLEVDGATLACGNAVLFGAKRPRLTAAALAALLTFEGALHRKYNELSISI